MIGSAGGRLLKTATPSIRQIWNWLVECPIRRLQGRTALLTPHLLNGIRATIPVTPTRVRILILARIPILVRLVRLPMVRGKPTPIRPLNLRPRSRTSVVIVEEPTTRDRIVHWPNLRVQMSIARSNGTLIPIGTLIVDGPTVPVDANGKTRMSPSLFAP